MLRIPWVGAGIASTKGGPFLGAGLEQEFPHGWLFELDKWSWLMMLARDARGDLFGEERIGEVAQEAVERGRGINASVMARLESHLDMQAAGDDITMLTVKPMESR